MACNIFVSDIVPAYIGNITIHNDNFAMFAEVELEFKTSIR